jgi:hypothetical protein
MLWLFVVRDEAAEIADLSHEDGKESAPILDAKRLTDFGVVAPVEVKRIFGRRLAGSAV